MNDITPKEAIANLNHLYGMVSPDMQRSLDVVIKAVERPSGDCISRSDLVQAFKKECCGNCHLCERFAVFENGIHHCGLIDNAQAIPLPSEQIAWEQGFEAGLAQGKVEITEEQAINKLHETGWLIGHDKEMTTRPQGEYIRKEDVIALLNKWADGYSYIEIPTEDAIKEIMEFNPKGDKE